ncbi:MAG: GntR family transcriptional regulator [Mesorhizobium sp.]|nr:GntR family transcriptional regulator [Mesorhizobium sp.]MBL8579101.1 GntR family transcriptional regulator [Mesorhizobium sp.]
MSSDDFAELVLQRGADGIVFETNSKAKQIYEIIRWRIVTLAMKPGEVINEHEIAEEFGVSRTPVREAVKKLEEEWLVSVQRRTTVGQIMVPIVEQGMVIRQTLELLGIERAAERITDSQLDMLDERIYRMGRVMARGEFDGYLKIDDDFHRLINMFSGYPTMWQLIHQSKGHLDRVRHLSAFEPSYLGIINDQHIHIFKALQARDASQAKEALRTHLDTTFERIRTLTSKLGKASG